MLEARKTSMMHIQDIFSKKTENLCSRKDFHIQHDPALDAMLDEFTSQLKVYYSELATLPLPSHQLRPWAPSTVWSQPHMHMPVANKEVQAILHHTLWDFYQRNLGNNLWNFIKVAARIIYTEAVYVHSYSTSLWKKKNLLSLKDHIYSICHHYFIPILPTWTPWIPHHSIKPQIAKQLYAKFINNEAEGNYTEEQIKAIVQEEHMEWMPDETSSDRMLRLKKARDLQEQHMLYMNHMVSMLVKPGMGTVRLNATTSKLLVEENDDDKPVVLDDHGLVWAVAPKLNSALNDFMTVSAFLLYISYSFINRIFISHSAELSLSINWLSGSLQTRQQKMPKSSRICIKQCSSLIYLSILLHLRKLPVS